MNNNVISINKGGLSNRIKSMVSCMRLSNEIFVKWDVLEKIINQIVHLLNCEYKELFKYPLEIKIITNNDITYKSHCLLIKEEDNIPVNFAKFKSNCKRKLTRNDKKGRNIDFEYNRIPEHMKKLYIPLFKKIKLTKELQIKIDDFYNKNMKDKFVISCHIRSWHTKHEESRRSLFIPQKFINKLKELNDQYKDCIIYLTSDCQKTKDLLLSKFNNIIIYNRKTKNKTSRENPNGIKEDLIELYLLSKCDILVGSHYSSYSEVAWWLSGCIKNVYIL